MQNVAVIPARKVGYFIVISGILYANI